MADLQNILDDIKGKIRDVVTLQIITAVGPVTINSDDKTKIDFANLKTIITKIDLLQGDITTVFDPEFVTGDYQSLKEFHTNREQQGNEIITNNIKTLQMLFDWISKLIKEEKTQ